MRTFVILTIVVLCLFTFSIIGQENTTDEKESPQKEVNISVEMDLPADMDLVVHKIANDIGEDLELPEVIKFCYGEANNPIETVDTLYGVNMVSSRNDTLFINPKAFWENKDGQVSFKEAVEIKLVEMSN